LLKFHFFKCPKREADVYQLVRRNAALSGMLFIALAMAIAGCSSGGGGAGFDPSSSTTISLAWDPPTSYCDGSDLVPAGIKEYRIYYRTETSSYSTGSYYPVSAPATSVTVTNLNLPSGTYSFIITAVDQMNMESGFSNEVSRTID
jgi:hypothetical protein